MLGQHARILANIAAAKRGFRRASEAGYDLDSDWSSRGGGEWVRSAARSEFGRGVDTLPDARVDTPPPGAPWWAYAQLWRNDSPVMESGGRRTLAGRIAPSLVSRPTENIAIAVLEAKARHYEQESHPAPTLHPALEAAPVPTRKASLRDVISDDTHRAIDTARRAYAEHQARIQMLSIAYLGLRCMADEAVEDERALLVLEG